MDRFIIILRYILIIFLVAWLLIWFSIRADKRGVNGNGLERAVVALAKSPYIVKRYIQNLDRLEKPINIQDDVFKLGYVPDKFRTNDQVYLLHYRYFGDDSGKVICQNIETGQVFYQWDIPLTSILDDLEYLKSEIVEKYLSKFSNLDNAFHIAQTTEGINIYSPVMTADSSLLFHCMFGYVYKIDKQSNMIWKSERVTHHSMEVDEEGNIWTCSLNFNNPFSNQHHFLDDAILCLNPDGTEKYFYSLTDIFLQNDVFKTLFAFNHQNKPVCSADPFHLNDVLPVVNDGPYWKKGDLFLSLRNVHMAMLYRPENDSIVWYKQGPWQTQHDVNIVNDSVISLFNNNVSLATMVNAKSNISYYHFGESRTVFMAENLFSSNTEGRHTQYGGDKLIIEETDKSMYYVLDNNESVKYKFFIPYYSNESRAQYPCWARIYLLRNDRFIML
jgi:hypothetical protein